MTNLICEQNLPLLQPWTDRFIALQSGANDAWQGFYHSDLTGEFASLWSELQKTGFKPFAINWDAPGCKLSNREVRRAIQCLIHLKDGRFASMVECIPDAIDSHPNPFAVRAMLADLESKFNLASRTPDSAEEAQVRVLAFG